MKPSFQSHAINAGRFQNYAQFPTQTNKCLVQGFSHSTKLRCASMTICHLKFGSCTKIVPHNKNFQTWLKKEKSRVLKCYCFRYMNFCQYGKLRCRYKHEQEIKTSKLPTISFKVCFVYRLLCKIHTWFSSYFSIFG